MGLISRLLERRLAAYQGDLIEKHYAEVENIYRQMRGWRHDYHNHIQTLQAYLASGDIQRIGPYLRALGSDLETVDTILKTGNIMVDAILNSKLSLAKREHIAIDATAHVPKELRVSEIDLCVALGNLLDNAMEACFRMEDAQARFIRV